MSTKKNQTQLLISDHMRERIGVLALIRNESRAEVSRTLLGIALPFLEKEHERDLEQIRKVAEEMGEEIELVAERQLARKTAA